MFGAWTLAQQREHVGIRAIPFVLAELITRVFLINLQHAAITQHLGNHAGTGNQQALGIPFDNGRGFTRKPFDGEPINQRMLRQVRQIQQGSSHGQMRGAKNIQFIYLAGFAPPHPNHNLGGVGKDFIKRLTSRCSQLLAVREIVQ